jgi:hypothetical protein
MDGTILRRDFLKAVPLAAGLAAPLAAQAGKGAASRIEPFDYQGVRLLPSRWLDQIERNRGYYLSLTNDDILQGFRAAAGLPAPGTPLGGWCERDSSPIFGQWLSGMARLSRATGDSTLHDKAVYLMTEWGKTVKPDGDCRMQHYAFDKLVCGLVDMHLYAGREDAIQLLEKVTDWAGKTFRRENRPAGKASFSGSPSEWYTLSENLYRAYQATGNPKFKAFAEVWLYHSYWGKFADTASPADAFGVHAYSHVNTFSSAAMHYEVTGDPTHLRIIRNAYDYLQHHQCFATGGYGPDERFLAPGNLGRALEIRPNTFETVCGSWAGFKLARYLMRFTGEARYGDWIERLFYNGVGAALPLTGRGSNFYYSDYRSTGGMKVYRYDNFTCCSGTLFQCIADYHNLVYYRDADGLYVNLYVPSELRWTRSGSELRLRQETDYPIAETSTLTLDMKLPMEFPLRFRVPEWCPDMSIKVNGAAAKVTAKPGSWAVVSRRWNPGDRIEVRIPLRFRWQPVDAQHPKRAAIVRGPVAMALDFRYLEPGFRPPQSDGELNQALTPDPGPSAYHAPPTIPGVYRMRGASGRPLDARLRPFFQYPEFFPYLMYIDLDGWPVELY